MKSTYVFALCAFFAVPHAFACGMTDKLVPFKPVATGVPVEAAATEVPAPIAVVTDITRGIGPKHASCDDTGLLSVKVEWPRGKYKLRDVGFEFRVVAGDPVYAIFPEGPFQAPSTKRESDFLFMWREGGPSQQKPIDLQVEVRAVTRDNQRGPPTRIVVRAAPGA